MTGRLALFAATVTQSKQRQLCICLLIYLSPRIDHLRKRRRKVIVLEMFGKFPSHNTLKTRTVDWHNSARTDHEILDDEEHNEDKQITTWYIVPRNAQNFPRGQFHLNIFQEENKGPLAGRYSFPWSHYFFCLIHSSPLIKPLVC